MTARLVVLASGSGTNLQAIIDACTSGRLDARVVHVITNRRDALALQRAESAGISSQCVPLREFETDLDDRAEIRRAYDAELASIVTSHNADFVVMAGWMHLLSGEFLEAFPNRVVNLHPALPGMFPGAHAIDDAWAAHLETGHDHTGVMVHLVPDEGVDNGPVVLSERVDILNTDTRDSLESRIHEVEHRLFVDAIDLLIRNAQMTAPTSDAQPSGFGLWVAGARPRTLPAAVVPVAVGAAVAVGRMPHIAWWRAVAALAVSLALQVGVNYANDYSDGVRGTDDGKRVGPLRLVGSGLASPRAVKRAAGVSFGVAGAVGAVLAIVVGPELFLVGALSLLAGWTYTGGPRPYGYLGLGEMFVFVFFGMVATVGTTYVLLEQVDGLAVAASVSVGLWATALLVVNNLRDIPGDTISGKRTLAVRLGDRSTRVMFVLMQYAAFGTAIVINWVSGRAAAAAILGIPFAISAMRSVEHGAEGRDLIPVLGATGRAQLVSGLAMAAGLALTG